MIACGNVILCYKITGASKGPPPTLVYVNGTINYNLKNRRSGRNGGSYYYRCFR